ELRENCADHEWQLSFVAADKGEETAEMSRSIESVAVLGAGTMGSGIAAASAEAGCRVLLLDVTRERAEQAIAAMTEGRSPALSDPAKAAQITPGMLESDLAAIRGHDWICEAVVEDLATKRRLFDKIAALGVDGSVISTNTSGIPLRAIAEGMPEALRRSIAVTHFFNPVKVMKLLEIVPGAETAPDVIERLADFGRERLGKGVVYAKDTVNFIGNRIGCFWMLSGLHKARAALADGVSMEEIDALMGQPVGIPGTGLYGLIDLIGLDVMDLVGRNLSANLPEGDPGHAYTELPATERAMLERGQLGRKTGGGFYRMQKADDGSRTKEAFDLVRETWRAAEPVKPAPPHDKAETLLFADDLRGRFAWELMGGTLLYAADLVPAIADDIVNIDRAMRWGFNWREGPFELMDRIGPARIGERLAAENRALPKMLDVLKSAGEDSFYRDGAAYLGLDGAYHLVPPA
ncbi:MAG: 3-hydroxyacyl-CoA dehydrogenase NAD-binding domain-containing protein, partial [Alphaproteobacteria bacterium]